MSPRPFARHFFNASAHLTRDTHKFICLVHGRPHGVQSSMLSKEKKRYAIIAAVCLAAFVIYGLYVLCRGSPAACNAALFIQAGGASGDVYVINLNRAPERLTSFKAQFEDSDLSRSRSFIRWNATDANEINWKRYLTPKSLKEVTESAFRGFRRKHYELTPGAIGCFLSHYYLWKSASTKPGERVFIFEDDALIDKRILGEHLACAWPPPKNADILLLSHFCAYCTSSPSSPWMRVKRFFSTAGYIVTKKGLKKLLSLIDPTRIEYQIDTLLSKLAMSDALVIYALKSKPVTQSPAFVTTIQMPIKPRSIEEAWAIS